jgi:flagellar biosynthetic protein FliR
MSVTSGMLAAFGLVLIRTSALVIASPVIGFGAGYAGHKVALIAFLSWILFWASGASLEPGTTPIDFGLLALREVLIGLFLAFFLHLTLLSARVTGELIGHEMGFMIASQADPATGVQTPLVASLYENLFVLGLLALNGHQWLIRALADSFERAPVGELRLSLGTVEVVQETLGQMLQAGIVFAAPVMVFLMIVSILIGLLSRAVPHLNVLEVGFTLRVTAALVALFVFAPMLDPALEVAYEGLSQGLDRALEVLGS